MGVIEELDISLNREKHDAGTKKIYISSLPTEVQNYSYKIFTTLLKIKGSKEISSSINAYFYAYRKFINWLNQTNQQELIIDKMKNNQVATQIEWKFALVRYKDYLVANYADTTITSDLSMLNALLKALSPRGLMPKFNSIPIEVPREHQKSQGDKDTKQDKKHYIVKHLMRTLQGMSYVKDTEIKKIVQLFNDIENKVAPDETERKLIIDLVVKNISDEHVRLKNKAESIFGQSLALLKEGEDLELCPVMAKCIFEMANKHKSIRERKGRNSEYTASRSIEKDFKEAFTEDQYLSAATSFIHYYADGTWPSANTPIGGALANRIWPIFGVQDLRNMLHPSAETISAAIILVVLQTALNGDSVITLNLSCLDIDSQGRVRGLYYYKKRSDKDDDGKEDVKPLSNNRKLFKYPVEKIVREFIRVSQKYRKHLKSNYLWITVPRKPGEARKDLIGELGVAPESYSRSALVREAKKIFNDDSVNSSAVGLDGLRRQILLLKALQSGAFAASVEADHKTNDTIKHYIDSDIITLKLNGKLNAFQSAFEFAIAQDIELFCERVGISKAEKEVRLKNMMQSGLGTLCLDKRYNPLTKELSSQDCTSFESCIGCAQFKPIVLLEVENIARLIAFHAHLIKSEAKCLIDNPANWKTKWYPWLLFTTGVMQFLDTPIHKKITKDAKAFLIKTPITMPELW